jgi:hypothetical protein
VRTCKACGEKRRVLTRAVVFHVDGTPPGGGLVCQTCARVRGLLVVASAVAPVRVEKVERPEGIERALRMLKTYAAAAKSEGLDDRAEGIEVAIEALRREVGE